MAITTSRFDESERAFHVCSFTLAHANRRCVNRFKPSASALHGRDGSTILWRKASSPNFGDFFVAQILLLAEQDGGALVFWQFSQRFLDFCASSPCNSVSPGGRKFFLSSYCRCGWPSLSPWVSSRIQQDDASGRRSSFRQRLRAMVNSHVENWRGIRSASRICKPEGKHSVCKVLGLGSSRNVDKRDSSPAACISQPIRQRPRDRPASRGASRRHQDRGCPASGEL